MATPHIAGLAAYLLGKGNYASPGALLLAITALANKNTRVVPPVPQGTTTLLGFNGV